MKQYYIFLFLIITNVILAQNTTTYQYDKFNRLTNSADKNTTFQYTFDKLGNRVKYVVTTQGTQQPDLLVENIVVSGSSLSQGANFTTSCDVSNAGVANATGNYLKVYLSNSTASTDTELGSQFIPAVSAGGKTSVNLSLKIPTSAESGTKYLVFEVDATGLIKESDETNNKSSQSISITTNTQPDLQLQSPQTSPSELLAGENATFNIDILNQGSENAGAFQLKCYLSLNPTFESYSDIEITEAVQNYTTLNSNSTVSFNKTVTIPVNTVPGIYYLLYVVDSENAVAEQNEDNNVASCTLTVLAPTGGGGNAPAVTFSADNQNIGEGTTVQFTEQSTNNPTSWRWSFPGGTPSFSTDQNPSVTYTNKGIYDVSLTASNSDGSNSLTKSTFISVGQPAQYDWLWHKDASGVTDITLSSNGNIIGVGSSSYGTYDADGEPLWTKTITGTNMRAVATDSDGNFFITGTIRSDNPIDFGNGHTVTIGNADGEDGFLAKFDSEGNTLWVHRIYDTDVSNATSFRTISIMDVCVDDAGNPFIVGYYEGFYGGSDFLYLRFPNGVNLRNEDQSYNLILAKFSSNGTTLWATEIEEYNGAGDIQAYSIDTDGEYVGLVGHFSGTIIVDRDTRSVRTATGSQDMFVLECNASTGDYESFEKYGGTESNDSFNYRERAYGIKYISNGYKYVTGEFIGNTTFGGVSLNSSSDMKEAFLLKSYNNHVSWAKKVSSPTNACFGTHLALDANEGVFWLGKYGINAVIDGITMDKWGTYIAKYNKSGDCEFINSVSDETFNYPWEASLVSDKEDNLYFADGTQISKYSIIEPVIHPKLKCENSLVCTGSNTIINAPEGYSSYQWSNGATTSSISATASGEYYVEVTDISGMSGFSDTITVEAVVSPSASITTNDNINFCEGGSATLSANTGSDYTYRWIKDGNYLIGASEDTFIGTETGTYQVETSSNGLCPMISNAISLKSESINASIVISIPDEDICQGDEISFEAKINNGGTAPFYQWQINGINAGEDHSTFSTSSYENNDLVTCILTSNSECVTNKEIISNELTVSTIPKPIAEIYTTDNTSFCNGGSAILKATLKDGYSYQWIKDGMPIIEETESSFLGTESGDYQVEVKNNGYCKVLSEEITLTSGSVNAEISISNLESEICEGGKVNFQASVSHEGDSPSYEWFVNSNKVGDNANTYIHESYSSMDTVSCLLVSNAECVETSSVWSNKIYLPTLPSPIVEVNTNDTTVFCEGNTTTLYTTNNSNYNFQWLKDDIVIDGANSFSYESGESGEYKVIVTNNGKCPVTSEIITLDVKGANPAISISAANKEICEGEEIWFDAILSDEGTMPKLQWFVNNNSVGSGELYYSSDMFSNNDTVSCVLISNAECASDYEVSSNKEVVLVTTLPIPDFLYVANDTIVIFTNESSNADSFSWDFGDGNSSSEENPVHIYHSSDEFTVTLTAFNNTCQESIPKNIVIDTAIKDISASGLIKVFPNPSEGLFRIVGDGISFGPKCKLQLYNSSGQIVIEESYSTENIDVQMDISDRQNGMYILKLSNDKYYAIIKLIKK